MGNLTVANKAQGYTFNVKIEGNVTIRNFKGNREMQSNEMKTVVEDGRITNYYKWGNAKNPRKERALNLNSSNYDIFNALRKADKKDKNGEYLTISDLEALRTNKALQKQLGVTVKYDPDEKVYGLYGETGSKLYFDFD